MANPDHFEIIKQGVEFWNQWRKEHRDIHPDLRGVNLAGAHLNDARFSFAQLDGANFSDAQLQRAYFVSSNLSHANCSRALLTEAHLDRATLKKTNLSGAGLQHSKIRIANLQGANLNRADLSFTKLERTSFWHANLHETNLSFANMRFNEFLNIDLSTARGLDTVIHSGTSHLGIQTLSRSLEHLPLAFLQGVGVPDSMLTYVRTLKQSTPVYATCLLSYASPDRNLAQKLQADLQAQGVLCGDAAYNVEGSQFIETQMIIYDMLLLVISEHTETEISRRALYNIVKSTLLKERTGFTPILLPISLSKAPQKTRGSWARLLQLAQKQSLDFTHWNERDSYSTAFAQLLHDLKAEIV